MSEAIAASDAYLFDIRPALRYTSRFTRYGIGEKVFAGSNPSYGALITYYLKDKLDDRTIEDWLAIGIGPKTRTALEVLRDQSKTMAVAKLPPPPAPDQAGHRSAK